jgi:hypothetical protein
MGSANAQGAVAALATGDYIAQQLKNRIEEVNEDGIVEQPENLQETTVTRTLVNRDSASFDIPGNTDPTRKIAWRARVTTTEGGKQPGGADCGPSSCQWLFGSSGDQQRRRRGQRT